MLAPLRDYLCPKDPMSSSLLCTTKEYYFARISVALNPNEPDFVKTQWIASEDANVEHLLDVFTTIDSNSDSIWHACACFLRHLRWHKHRLVILKPKIEGLPDDHSSKPECLFELSRLLHSVGSQAERKQLLTHALKLERERGDDRQVIRILRHLANANGLMGLHKEGIRLAKEALEMGEWLGDRVVQAQGLAALARRLRQDEQFNAAEEAASRAIGLFPEKGEEYRVCKSHRILGEIYRSKGKTAKAIHHLKAALVLASSFDWPEELFLVHYRLADIFCNEGRFDEAHAHIEHAKSYTANSAYNLAYAMEGQALVWYKQHKFKEARSAARYAAEVYKELGVAKCSRGQEKFSFPSEYSIKYMSTIYRDVVKD